MTPCGTLLHSVQAICPHRVNLLSQEGAMRLAPRAANQHAYNANDRIVVIANSGC